MKAIMACIDFSAATDRVLETAARLAKATGRPLTVAHVRLLPISVAYNEWFNGEECIAAMAQAGRENQWRLESICEQLGKQFAIQVTPLVLEETRAAAAILREAQKIDPELIVMGSHGYGMVGQLLLGSTSEEVLHKSKWPVLVVPTARMGASRPDAPAKAVA